MTIGTTDIFLLVIIASSLVVGFFWGAGRSLMLLAAWLLAFLAGAYLRLTLGSYLSQQWDNFAASWNEMAAFGIIHLGIFLAAPIVIFVSTRGSQRVARSQALDDVIGASVAVICAVLGIAGLMMVFATYYGGETGVVDPTGGPTWTATLYQSLLSSNIGSAIQTHLIPIFAAILGPILPADLGEAIA